MMANKFGVVDLPEVSGSWEYVTQYLSRWADRLGLPEAESPLPPYRIECPIGTMRSVPLRADAP